MRLSLLVLFVFLLRPAHAEKTDYLTCRTDYLRFCPGQSWENLEKYSYPCLMARLELVSPVCLRVLRKKSKLPCMQDLLNFCYPNSIDEISRHDCLKERLALLSPRCKKETELEAADRAMAEKVCGGDFTKYCPDPNRGIRANCMRKQYQDAKLAPDCMDYVKAKYKPESPSLPKN